MSLVFGAGGGTGVPVSTQAVLAAEARLVPEGAMTLTGSVVLTSVASLEANPTVIFQMPRRYLARMCGMTGIIT